MAKKYFGTDGIRGQANGDVLTPELAMKLGMAAGIKFRRGEHRHRVVIGKDTRRSGYMLEMAMTAGFAAVGVDVFLLGPMPTPAIALLTRSMRADLGVMISASHNAFGDNGIKMFKPDGYKLSDGVEREIEKLLDSNLDDYRETGIGVGRVKRVLEAQGRYVEFAKATFPKRLNLEGMRIVIDCAHGAGYKVAPQVLWELGAEIIPLGVTPNGSNINDGVGSTEPEVLVAKVRDVRADIGIALDGDADRVLIVDERGHIVDGDQLMAVIAKFWQSRKQLSGGGIAATVMSNLGLERYLNSLDLTLERTKVGDRYVVEAMRAKGMNVGGEQSGHIILSDHATTGDGLVAALQVLAVVRTEGKPVSQVCHCFDPVPQVLKNVRYSGANPLSQKSVKKVIEKGKDRLGSSGRLVIRKSGTEPLVRVMGEGDEAKLMHAVVNDIVKAIESVI